MKKPSIKIDKAKLPRYIITFVLVLYLLIQIGGTVISTMYDSYKSNKVSSSNKDNNIEELPDNNQSFDNGSSSESDSLNYLYRIYKLEVGYELKDNIYTYMII